MFGLFQIMALKQTVQSIECLRPLRDESSAVGKQGSYLPHVVRRNPDRWDQTGSQELRQFERVARIGLDARGGKQFDR
ncbi:hypothetical protein KSB_67710 [Ktedonobacter robiniae]|uniref:Uncharacterized protein n=1 Tax=Ktedonobacter robiniae TaxID=2778365 RepID=A0ABQ3UZH9_9CHLR|nr:hypothetical protein KSB_67710 [Ktedonobacter robiniae]